MEKAFDTNFCTCNKAIGIYIVEDDFGYWEVCSGCNKKLEDGYHYYNHYDGEDHDDCDIW